MRSALLCGFTIYGAARIPRVPPLATISTYTGKPKSYLCAPLERHEYRVYDAPAHIPCVRGRLRNTAAAERPRASRGSQGGMSDMSSGRRKGARQRRPPPVFSSSPQPTAKATAAAAAAAKAKRARVDELAEEAAAAPRENDPSAFAKAPREAYGACNENIAVLVCYRGYM